LVKLIDIYIPLKHVIVEHAFFVVVVDVVVVVVIDVVPKNNI